MGLYCEGGQRLGHLPLRVVHRRPDDGERACGARHLGNRLRQGRGAPRQGRGQTRRSGADAHEIGSVHGRRHALEVGVLRDIRQDHVHTRAAGVLQGVRKRGHVRPDDLRRNDTARQRRRGFDQGRDVRLQRRGDGVSAGLGLRDGGAPERQRAGIRGPAARGKCRRVHQRRDSRAVERRLDFGRDVSAQQRVGFLVDQGGGVGRADGAAHGVVGRGSVQVSRRGAHGCRIGVRRPRAVARGDQGSAPGIAELQRRVQCAGQVVGDDRPPRHWLVREGKRVGRVA